MNPSKSRIDSILSAAETIAVVGLSDDTARASHRIAVYLKEAGYRVIPINPKIQCVLGEKAYARLGDVEEHVDIVNVFRRSEEVPSLLEETLKKRPAAFWMQKGISHPESAHVMESCGITTIQDLCIKVAHRNLTRTPR